VTDHHDTPEPGQPDSLLRRLSQHDEARTPADDAPNDPPPLSPIRPTLPRLDDTPLVAPLAPQPPPPTPVEYQLTPREKMQRAEDALITLREKMARVAAEFDAGKLNQAQFDAIYARYSEQRDITERLLTRDPESKAWQSVVQAGHTQFLKQHYAARPLSYAIYDQRTFERITVTGRVQLRQPQVEAVLARLQTVIAQRGNPGPARRTLSGGKVVLFVPGDYTAAVVLFSLEPAVTQFKRVQDLHRDFERANRRALDSQDYQTTRMVFPHRALFEMETR
jgi:hypothetical protein